MTDVASKPVDTDYWAGVGAGAVAVLAWAIYNVGAKFGASHGFRAPDLMLARAIGAGVLTLPFLLWYGVRDLGGVGWRRAIVLTLLIGPPFGFFVGVGFVLAPLAHGLVVGPSMTMVATALLARWFMGVPLDRPRIAGIAILACSLLVLAWDGLADAVGVAVLLGDLGFIAAAWLWGIFTLLIGRWNVDPWRGTAAVCVLSMALVIPVYAVVFDAPAATAAQWGMQAALQGGLGGCVAVFAFGLAVRRLGSVRAGLFPSMVPAVGILVSVPILGQGPDVGQVAGIVLASLGLAVGLGGFTALAGRLSRRCPVDGG